MKGKLDAVGGGLPVFPRRGVCPYLRAVTRARRLRSWAATSWERPYEQQFEDDLEQPIREDVDRGRLWACCGLRAGWRPACSGSSTIRKSWVWSDLHLGRPGTISVIGRPFEGPEDMDKRLFGVWRRTVRPDDTIICLGDVVFSGLWGKRRKRAVAAPGRRKILVFGNHELGIAGVGVPGIRRDLQRALRRRRPAVADDALPPTSGPGGVREPARPSSQRDRAGQHPSHQRLRRAGALSAKIADGDPSAREAPGSG